jgi:inosine-uridine nucleoside N-ribohydrolase
MLLVRVSVAQLPTPNVLDADIGGNIDDALALLLSSPALDLRTVTTVSGEARARTDSLAES